MDGRMFDGIINGLLLMGVAMGVALCGLAWALFWLFSHVSIRWVS